MTSSGESRFVDLRGDVCCFGKGDGLILWSAENCSNAPFHSLIPQIYPI